MNLGSIQWGNAPAWVGGALSGLSVLLAMLIFRRDRRERERSQVDQLGVWVTTQLQEEEFERFRGSADLGDAILKTVVIELHVRNASNLPLRMEQAAIEINTKWLVPDHSAVDPLTNAPTAYSAEKAKGPRRLFQGPALIPPQETVAGQRLPYDMSDLAPDGASQLTFVEHSYAVVRWVLVIDNAGRRWEVRPISGRPARRVRRWWRLKEYQPVEW
jgi:hypothetical protein